jgi:hypothetical protein
MSTVYNKTAFELAHARMRLAPIELTGADLDQLGTIDPALETKGREAHRQAQLAIVQQHTAPPLETKSVTAAPPSTMDEFLQRYGTQQVTWAGLSKVLTETDGLLKAITALKQRAATFGTAQRNPRGARVWSFGRRRAAGFRGAVGPARSARDARRRRAGACDAGPRGAGTSMTPVARGMTPLSRHLVEG